MINKSKQGSAKIVTIAVVIVIIGMLMSWQLWRMNVKRGEIDLGNRFDAQQSVVEATLFNMRSAIKNIHSCTDEWADNFIKVVTMQAEGRKGAPAGTAGGEANPAASVMAAATATGAGTSFQFSRESEALGIPPDLHMKLANAIEGQLADFTRQQVILTDIWRSHTTYCKDPYHNWLGLSMMDYVKTQPEMITSGETKDAVESKRMDEKMF